MAIERKPPVPYEFLVRFNDDGTVKGQHIKFISRIIDTDTGEVISEQEGDAMPVGSAEGQVPLETALNRIGARLAKAEEAERLRREAAEAAKAEADAAREAALAEREAALADRAAKLQAAKDALLSALTVVDPPAE